MTVLAITGIGGFIGLRMCERAQALGWTVRGLDHTEVAADRARALGVEVVVADINDGAALRDLFTGVDRVFHTAAVVAEDGRASDYRRVNVTGTDSVCSAAAEAGVKRLVHLSSVMVYGFDYLPEVDEEQPLNGQGNVYSESKVASDLLARGWNGSGGLEVVVVRPGDVYGVGSQPWLERPLALLRKRLFALPAGTGVINHVHVDNLIDGVLLAFEHSSAGGEAFNITDGVATPCATFFQYHATMAERPLMRLPAPLLTALIGLMEIAARLLGQSPPASRAGIRFLQRRHRYSTEKARNMLGYRPRISLDEGMADIAQRLGKGPIHKEN